MSVTSVGGAPVQPSPPPRPVIDCPKCGGVGSLDTDAVASDIGEPRPWELVMPIRCPLCMGAKRLTVSPYWSKS